MNTVEFKETLARYLQAPITLPPIFVLGDTGIGKTMISLETARQLRFVPVILQIGTKTIEYFTGIPSIDEQRKRAIWTMPDLVGIVKDIDDPVMLLIDDAHLAMEETVKVLWEMLSNRTLHNYEFPKTTKFLFAANPYTEEFGATVSNMPKPIRSRVCVLEMTNHVDRWLELSYQRQIHPFVTGFVSAHKEFFNTEPDAEGMYCSPRGWWNLSSFLTENFPLHEDLIAGFTGKAAAQEFMVFHKTYMQYAGAVPEWKTLKTSTEKAAFITYLLIHNELQEIKQVITEATQLGVTEDDTVFLTVLIKVIKAAKGEQTAFALIQDVPPETVSKIVSTEGGL